MGKIKKKESNQAVFIKIHEKDFALLQYTISSLRRLATQFKFQIQDYSIIIDKCNKLEKLLMHISEKFNAPYEEMMQAKAEKAIELAMGKAVKIVEDITEDEGKERESGQSKNESRK